MVPAHQGSEMSQLFDDPQLSALLAYLRAHDGHEVAIDTIDGRLIPFANGVAAWCVTCEKAEKVLASSAGPE